MPSICLVNFENWSNCTRLCDTLIEKRGIGRCEMKSYGGTIKLAAFFRFIGQLLLIVGIAFLFLIGVAIGQSSAPSPMGALLAAALIGLGFTLLAVGVVIKLLVDLCRNTRALLIVEKGKG